MGDSSLFLDDRLGLQVVNLALQRGYITPDQWSDALARQAGAPGASVAGVLLDLGYLSRERLGALRAELERERGPRPLAAPLGQPPSTVSPPPQPHGPVPFGRFLLRREIGRGGRGSVYEALDTASGRRVAVKLIRNAPDARPDEMAREEQWFLREAELALHLPLHPGIVRVLDTGISQGKRWISLELVEGLELDRWAALHDAIRDRVAVLHDVALAVHAAHDAGVVHRDLKPRNILVDSAGRPRVTDFGTARSVRQDPRASVTAWGTVVGTAVYMSPEQAAADGDVDRRADVYSLGIILYEFLCGRAPFEGSTAVETILKAMTRPPRRPSEFSPRTVDPVLEEICLRAISRDRRDRPSSALEFAEQLRAWIDGSRPRLRLSARRKRRIAAGLLAAALAGAAAFGLARGPSADPAVVSLEPGLPRGLRLPERLAPAALRHAGRPCLEVPVGPDGWGLLPLDADDAWAASAAAVEVEVDYFDASRPGSFFAVQYDSTDERLWDRGAAKWAGTVWLTGTNAWRTWRAVLPDPGFANRQADGSDLRLFSGTPGLRVARVALRAIDLDRAAPLHPRAFKADRAAPAGLAPGLRAEFFRGRDRDRSAGVRVDPGIAFVWENRTGPFGLVDDYSARWTGWLRVPKSGRYLLELESDNGARLRLHGATLLEDWEAHASRTSLLLCDLEEGLHPFELEYYELTDRASVLFSCLAPSGGKPRDVSRDGFVHRP